MRVPSFRVSTTNVHINTRFSRLLTPVLPPPSPTPTCARRSPFTTMSTRSNPVRYTTNSTRPALPDDVPEADKARSGEVVDDYLDSKLSAPDFAGDPSLEKSRQRADEAGVPEIAVSPQQGQFLSVLLKGMGASKVLEIGTLWGYSTVFLTRALPKHGQIDTLEVNPMHAKVANQTFIDADLYPFPKIHVGPALETLKKMGASDPIDTVYDFVFIDADKENVLNYFLACLPLVRKGGILFFDNAVRGGRIAYKKNDRPDVDVDGFRSLYDWVEKDNGKTVLMSGIQTVGSKLWDGFAIATKL